MLLVILTGCSENKDSQPNKSPLNVIGFFATDEVLQGSGNFGDLTSPASKMLTFNIKNTGTLPLVGPVTLEDSSNFAIIYKNNCDNVLPTKTCQVKVNFTSNGKAPGSYNTKLNLDRVFVSLSSNVIAPVVINAVDFKNGTTVITSMDYGTITDLQSVYKTISIQNKGSQTITLATGISSADFSIIFDTCSNKSLAAGASCQVKVSLSGEGKSGTVNANLNYGTFILPLTAVVNSTIVEEGGSIEYSQTTSVIEELPYGDVEPGTSVLKSITIKNTSTKSISYPVSLTGTGYSLIYDMCSNKTLAPQGKCLIKIHYVAPAVAGANNGIVSMNAKELILTSNIILPPPPVVVKPILSNVNSVANMMDFGNKEQDTGETGVFSMTIKNDSGVIQKFTQNPVLNNYTIVNNGCLNINIGKNATCIISLKFDSSAKLVQVYEENFQMESLSGKIEFKLKTNVIASTTVIPCDMANAVSGGVNNSNLAVMEVQGNFPLCEVKTCQALYNISLDQKSCEAQVVACSSGDIAALGGNNNHALSFLGSVVAGNREQCKINSCDTGYSVSSNGLSCQAVITYEAVNITASCSSLNLLPCDGSSNLTPSYRCDKFVAGVKDNSYVSNLSDCPSVNMTPVTCLSPQGEKNVAITNGDKTVSCAEGSTVQVDVPNSIVCDNEFILENNMCIAPELEAKLGMFYKNEASTGTELWAFPSSGVPYLIKDINPGTGSSYSNLNSIEMNGKFYFTANNGVNGGELWVTNGLESGTYMVKDINPGSGGSSIDGIAKTSNKLFFRANSNQLWSSDGTANGTIQVGTVNSLGYFFGEINNKMLFSWNNALYSTDGTAGNLVNLKNVGQQIAFPVGKLGNKIIFIVGIPNTEGNMKEVWSTDGTTGGTVKVGNLFTQSLYTIGANDVFTLNNNKLVFIARKQGTQGEELWMYNGSTVSRVTSNVFIRNPLFFNNKVAFQTASTMPSPWTVMVYDGTSALSIGTVSYPGIISMNSSGGKLFTIVWNYQEGTATEPTLLYSWTSGSSWTQVKSFTNEGYSSNLAALGNDLFFLTTSYAGASNVKMYIIENGTLNVNPIYQNNAAWYGALNSNVSFNDALYFNLLNIPWEVWKIPASTNVPENNMNIHNIPQNMLGIYNLLQ